MALADAPDIDVVVELIGGSGGVARRLVQRALRSGKHVVTANKALLAMHGDELAALAEKNDRMLAFGRDEKLTRKQIERIVDWLRGE